MGGSRLSPDRHTRTGESWQLHARKAQGGRGGGGGERGTGEINVQIIDKLSYSVKCRRARIVVAEQPVNTL